MRNLDLLTCGPVAYMDVDALQRSLHQSVAHLTEPDTFISWEAEHTYTAGRRTQPEDIPSDDVPVIRMDRGGSVTYHGPGQLVVYPIVKVRPPKDVVAFVRSTERAVMDAVAEFGIRSHQVDGRSGVWISASDTPTGVESKLCAIGIKFADDATMHGLALNVTTDISRFFRVVPCGISDAGVVSLEQLGVTASLADVRDVLLSHLRRAYEPFLLRDDDGAVHTIDGRDALTSAITSTHHLPPKTGVAWTQPSSTTGDQA